MKTTGSISRKQYKFHIINELIEEGLNFFAAEKLYIRISKLIISCEAPDFIKQSKLNYKNWMLNYINNHNEYISLYTQHNISKHTAALSVKTVIKHQYRM